MTNRYETVGQRLIAAFIDWLILMPVTIYVCVFTTVFAEAPMVVGIAGLVSVFYFILFHAYRGQTFGKMIMKIRITDERGGPLNFIQAVLRSLPALIVVMYQIAFANHHDLETVENVVTFMSIGVLVFFVLDAAVLLFNEKHRALHDLIAKTVVVKTKP